MPQAAVVAGLSRTACRSRDTAGGPGRTAMARAREALPALPSGLPRSKGKPRMASVKDAEGNILVGDHVNIDTTNTISFSSGKMIATIGVDNLVVVETEDAILVCD